MIKGINPDIFVEHLRNNSKHKNNIHIFLDTLKKDNTKIFISLFMLIKTEYLLRTEYKVSKNKIIEILICLLETKDVVIDDEGTLEDALRLWKYEDQEFLDYLILAKNFRCGGGPIASL